MHRAPHNCQGRGPVPWRKLLDGVSLGRAKADSPSPRDGPEHSVLEIGSPAFSRAVSPRGGECHDRVNMTVFCIDGRRVRYGGCATATKADSDGLNQRGASNGRMRIESSASASPLATRMSLRSFERVNSSRSENGRIFFCRTIRSRHSAKQRPIKPICER